MKTERVQDQKEKMQAELQALWKEQCDQLRKRKEQFATEVSGVQKKEATVVDELFFFFSSACKENIFGYFSAHSQT